MPIYFDRSRQRWRFEFDRRVDGRRQRATKLLPASWSRAQAEAYAKEQDNQLYAVATGAVKHRPLISEAVLVYLKEHAPGLKNFNGLEREFALVANAIAGRYMDELAEVAKEYTKANAKTLKPATVKNRIAYLRAACRWAWKNAGIGEHDPAERLVLPKVRNERHNYLSRKQALQLARLVRNLDARACVLVAFYSGMRLSELLRAEPTARGWLLTDTKNGDRRLVPIHPKVRHLARSWPRAIAARTVQGGFERARAVLGLDAFHFHDLRHSAASEMINAGVDLFTVGGVLGHKAPASMKRYSHLANDTLSAAVNRIGRKRG